MPAAQRPQRLKPPRAYLAGFEKLDRPNLAGFWKPYCIFKSFWRSTDMNFLIQYKIKTHSILTKAY
jgi:hypothetical protein